MTASNTPPQEGRLIEDVLIEELLAKLARHGAKPDDLALVQRTFDYARNDVAC
jgi:hypothetical protein